MSVEIVVEKSLCHFVVNDPKEGRANDLLARPPYSLMQRYVRTESFRQRTMTFLATPFTLTTYVPARTGITVYGAIALRWQTI